MILSGDDSVLVGCGFESLCLCVFALESLLNTNGSIVLELQDAEEEAGENGLDA